MPVAAVRGDTASHSLSLLQPSCLPCPACQGQRWPQASATPALWLSQGSGSPISAVSQLHFPLSGSSSWSATWFSLGH